MARGMPAPPISAKKPGIEGADIRELTGKNSPRPKDSEDFLQRTASIRHVCEHVLKDCEVDRAVGDLGSFELTFEDTDPPLSRCFRRLFFVLDADELITAETAERFEKRTGAATDIEHRSFAGDRVDSSRVLGDRGSLKALRQCGGGGHVRLIV